MCNARVLEMAKLNGLSLQSSLILLIAPVLFLLSKRSISCQLLFLDNIKITGRHVSYRKGVPFRLRTCLLKLAVLIEHIYLFSMSLNTCWCIMFVESL